MWSLDNHLVALFTSMKLVCAISCDDLYHVISTIRD